MYTIFHNKGNLDLNFIRMFGVSAKVGKNPIGYFGTGMKYAIAVALRHGCEVMLFIDGEEYRFYTESMALRDKQFEQILCRGPNGEFALPFTTELGKRWELWMAYRELFCNATDEGGGVRTSVELPQASGLKDHTFFAVTNMEEVAFNHDEYFFTPQASDWHEKGVIVRNTPGQHLFYKGVRVFTLPMPAEFTYNFTGPMGLTEDRTLENPYSARTDIAKAIASSSNKAFIQPFMLNTSNRWDDDLDLHWTSMASPVFLEVAREAYERFEPRLNRSLLNYFAGRTDLVREKVAALSDFDKQTLKLAQSLLAGIGYPAYKYPIHVSSGFAEELYGLADTESKEVFIADRCFLKGGLFVASTLLEEIIHLETGYRDETYELQTYLFDQIVRLGVQQTGIRL